MASPPSAATPLRVSRAEPQAQQTSAQLGSELDVLDGDEASEAPPSSGYKTSTVVSVRTKEHPLKSAPQERGPYREYCFVIEARGETGELRGRFSDLERSLGSLGPFPKEPLSILKNYTTNEENVQKRAEELRVFLKTLLNDKDAGGKLSSTLFRAALQIDEGSPLSAAFKAIGAERHKKAAAAREAAMTARMSAMAQQQW